MAEDFAKTRRCGVLFFLASMLCVPCGGQEMHEHPAPTQLGTVSFPTSCRPEVQKDFERSVALLHSFAYAAAKTSFQSVAEKDPHCAMAHWGIAMTYFHGLWDPPIRPEGMPAGREEIGRAAQMSGVSDREERFIHALALFYGRDGAAAPYHERVSIYEASIADLAIKYPEDPESQIFYALALLESASPFDKTHAKQQRAARILGPLWSKYPEHPGIAHYLIHACDNQQMAPLGLAAAQAYSKIAPAAPHALHMPSHIFTRLGMWDDSIASNQAARAAAHRQHDLGEELHAMDYLVYAYLQEGRNQEAHAIVEQLHTMPHLDEGDFKIAYAAAAMPVRYAIERRQWSEAAVLAIPHDAPPHVTAVGVWARATGLARSGHPAEARPEIARLRQLEEKLRGSAMEYGDYWARQAEIQAKEASAWVAQAESKTDEARDLLRQAAEEEDAIEKLPVTPGPIIPAREQLGDLLLDQGQPKLALSEFQTSLRGAPKRRGALDGVSRASAALEAAPTAAKPQ